MLTFLAGCCVTAGMAAALYGMLAGDGRREAHSDRLAAERPTNLEDRIL